MIKSCLPDNNGVGDLSNFKLANTKNMRRSPDLVSTGNIYKDSAVNDAIELAETGHRAFCKTKAHSIGSIIPDLIRLFKS